jgi:Zn-dependent M28 family amino/carboxypeptidase
MLGLAAFLTRSNWQALLTRVPFDGATAFTHIDAQLAFGPRLPGALALTAASRYIRDHLQANGWHVEFQDFTYKETPVRNIIAKANVGRGPIILLGAHYDSRRRADQDRDNPEAPVPGANDGASGVAVLLELGRSLDLETVPNEIWLAFFDAEDNGNLDGWEWLVGSTYMAQNLTVKPAQMILVDMIGDADQQIYFEQGSNPDLSATIWAVADELGYGDYIIPEPKYHMVDDHVPFLMRGIPAIDIIDFDYPYWHTTQDTADKVSVSSLERVGRTLETYLENPR